MVHRNAVAARRRAAAAWPNGRPTIVCPRCEGTGMDAAQAHVYLSTRALLSAALRDAAVRCAACDGRGRLTPEHALAQGIMIP